MQRRRLVFRLVYNTILEHNRVLDKYGETAYHHLVPRIEFRDRTVAFTQALCRYTGVRVRWDLEWEKMDIVDVVGITRFYLGEYGAPRGARKRKRSKRCLLCVL